jgi:hypothetical protein
MKTVRPRFAIVPLRAGSLVGAAVALLVALTASAAWGSGDERTTNADDLTIRTDTRWAGGAAGGYLPIRVHIANHGAPRDLTFEFEPVGPGGGGVRARRQMGVDQNGTVNFTLSVPLIDSRDGRLHVYEGSRLLNGHDRSISVPSAIFTSPSPPSLLVISPTAVDCGRYVEAAKYLVSGGSSAPYYLGGSASDSSVLADVARPDLLPDSWIDYSGLDFLAISRDEFERLEHRVRTAIVKWVQCGGNLLIYEVGSEAAALARLDRMIDGPDVPATGAAWQDANPTVRPTEEIKVESEEESSGYGPRRAPSARPKSSATGARGAAKVPESPWHASKNTFHSRALMLGTVYAFADNPFPGSISDWLWLCKSCGPDRWSWTTRHGSSPHFGTKDFFKFMNPGIHGVPTIAFFVLISVFGVVIGPVNYVYLSRRKMLWLLLFTVPALAFTTSALLVGYSMAAHGFATRSRVRSLTVLDQRNQTAVTMSRLALFAGVAPSGGMRFSPDTAVYPVIPTTNEPRGGVVDWTETQHLVSGWLPARTRTQFYTVRNSEQRARVEFKQVSGTAQFANGLPWELEMVMVSDPQGRLYTARSVAAGGTVALAEAGVDDRREFSGLLQQNAPVFPSGFVEPTITPMRGGRAWATYMMRSGAMTDFSSNLMERRISEWNINLTVKSHLPPRTYLAVVRENPGVETGVSATSDSASLHVLNGNF